MGSPFDIVKDSSIWQNSVSLRAHNKLDAILYTGIVRSVSNSEDTGELRYLVEVRYRGDLIPTSCRMMRRFGGAFNYEDTVMRGYDYNTAANEAARAGDLVLVGLIGGQGREGVILGGLTHHSRPNLSAKNGPEYKSEFNGIETYINKDGEYTLTFKAQPTNLVDLDAEPSGRVPAPKYDKEIGTSFLKWDKTGSFTISDNATNNPQTFFVDKEKGTIELISGSVSLKLDKQAKKIVATSPDIRLGDDSVTEQAVLGTTYRSQETQMNATLYSSLISMGISLNSAGSFLNTASLDPVLAGLAPVAAVAIAAAAQVIIAAATQANTMARAISSFESSAPSYLSNVVKVG